jgi:hypothetical protein
MKKEAMRNRYHTVYIFPCMLLSKERESHDYDYNRPFTLPTLVHKSTAEV